MDVHKPITWYQHQAIAPFSALSKFICSRKQPASCLASDVFVVFAVVVGVVVVVVVVFSGLFLRAWSSESTISISGEPLGRGRRCCCLLHPLVFQASSSESTICISYQVNPLAGSRWSYTPTSFPRPPRISVNSVRGRPRTLKDDHKAIKVANSTELYVFFFLPRKQINHQKPDENQKKAMTDINLDQRLHDPRWRLFELGRNRNLHDPPAYPPHLSRRILSAQT